MGGGMNLTNWKKLETKQKTYCEHHFTKSSFSHCFYLNTNLFVLQGPVDPFRKSEKKNEKAEDGLEESFVRVGYV